MLDAVEEHLGHCNDLDVSVLVLDQAPGEGGEAEPLFFARGGLAGVEPTVPGRAFVRDADPSARVETVGDQISTLCDDNGVEVVVLAWPDSCAHGAAVTNSGAVSCISFPAGDPSGPQNFVRGFVKSVKSVKSVKPVKSVKSVLCTTPLVFVKSVKPVKSVKSVLCTTPLVFVKSVKPVKSVKSVLCTTPLVFVSRWQST